MKLKNLLLIALIFLFISSCGKQNEEDVIKIGAILPLTGSGAELAQQHSMGLELAIDSLNRSGNDTKFKLIIYDDQNLPKNSVTLVRKLIDVDSVDVIITVISTAALAIAPIIEESQIPHFANVGHPTITDMYKTVFRNFPSTKQEVHKMLTYAKDSLNIKTIGLLFIDDAYGRGAEQQIREVSKKMGINIVVDASYGKDATDTKAIVTEVLAKKPEAVYVYGYGMKTAEVVNKIKELGFKGFLLGTYNFAQPPLTTVAIDAIKGSYYTVPTFQNIIEFSNNYFWNEFKIRYGTSPPWNGVVEYDALMIINKAVNLSKEKDSKLIEALNKVGDFRGIGGNYEFETSKDWLIPMSIVKVDSDGSIIIK